uniref:Uncharacterized protein n=1 Tax=Lygus hesperus TaxID=30085 RepID=A0A146KR82_LYGHE
MLKATPLFRSLLSRSSITTQNLCLHRVSATSLKLIPKNPVWKLHGSSRSIMEGADREVSPSVEAALRTRDNVPNDFRIIYRAPHETYVKVTYMTAVIAIVTVPVLMAAIYLTGNFQTYPVQLDGLTLFETQNDAYLLVGLLCLTIFNVANTVSKYPMRIYRNPLENNYIGVFQHPIPGMIKRINFVAGDVTKGGGWIFKDSTFTIRKKKKVLLIPENFSTPFELERMTIAPPKDSPVEKQKRRSRMV